MPASDPKSGDKTILVIDDDREIASTLYSVLTAAGYQVHLAGNGAEGQRMIDQIKPQLVITDMMMPRMGGFPVLEHIRSLPDRPAMIMITANEGGRHKAYAEMLGVADYLRKPFPMESLLESVRRVFSPGDEDKPAKKATRKKASP